MKFRGHETFAIRKGWLNKGVKNIQMNKCKRAYFLKIWVISIDEAKCKRCKMCVTAKYLDGGCLMDKYLKTKEDKSI